MEAIKNWISGICAVSLMIAILKAILPDNFASKTFNMIASLVLIIAVVGPIKNLEFNAIEFEIAQRDENIEEKVAAVSLKNAEIADRVIEKELCEYICKKANLKAEEIEISCSGGEIIGVILRKNSNEAKEVLKNDCGVDEGEIIVQGA